MNAISSAAANRPSFMERLRAHTARPKKVAAQSLTKKPSVKQRMQTAMQAIAQRRAQAKKISPKTADKNLASGMTAPKSKLAKAAPWVLAAIGIGAASAAALTCGAVFHDQIGDAASTVGNGFEDAANSVGNFFSDTVPDAFNNNSNLSDTQQAALVGAGAGAGGAALLGGSIAAGYALANRNKQQ